MSVAVAVKHRGGILGIRTARDSGQSELSYGWDELNRMTGYGTSVFHDDYTYRADGMRVLKSHVNSDEHGGWPPSWVTSSRFLRKRHGVPLAWVAAELVRLLSIPI